VLKGASEHEEHDLQHSWDRHEQLQRNLAQQLKRERRTLDAGLAVLASIGSTAPFVGLFGTVWGIMSAMHDISKNVMHRSTSWRAHRRGAHCNGNRHRVAIPAVLAYNFFLRRLKSTLGGYEDFAHDFLNLAQRCQLSRRAQRARRKTRACMSGRREVNERESARPYPRYFSRRQVGLTRIPRIHTGEQIQWPSRNAGRDSE